MQSFSLRKWYADCINREGATFIGYAVDLTWGPVHVRYGGTLTCDGYGRPVHARYTNAGIATPVAAEGEHVWQLPGLHVSGHWHPRIPPMERRLFGSRAGSVYWSCAVPAATVRVESADRPPLEGLGYLERIDMTVVPWELPVGDLRWGRFISDTHTAVWMRWRGRHSLDFSYFDGVLTQPPEIEETGVRLGSTDIEFESRWPLRKGSFEELAGSAVPELLELVPEPIRLVHEEKWLSPTRVTIPGESPITGWAIHEHVVLPEPTAGRM